MAKKEIIEINLKHKEAEIKKRKAELEAYRLQSEKEKVRREMDRNREKKVGGVRVKSLSGVKVGTS